MAGYGFAVVFETTTGLIRRGLAQASLLATGMALLVMLVALRGLRGAVLAVWPLVFALAGVLGIMGWLGLRLNMASQLALPILLGTAVDYGILMTRRWREPDGADPVRVIRSMGGTIGLAGATTMIGFGSLMLARHRGLATFGGLAAGGVALAMGAAVLGIPVLIRAFRLDRRRKEP